MRIFDAAHGVHARVEDAIHTGKDTGRGHLPSLGYGVNQAWLASSMIAIILPAWLKLLALDGDLGPQRYDLRGRSCMITNRIEQAMGTLE
jgi:hypothetical protein